VVNLAARDLDGDAILDVLFSVTSGKLAFVSGLGAGAFGPESVLSLSLGGAAEIEIADMNGDGTLDVLVGDIGVLPLSWFEGIGGGAFGMQQAIGAGTQDSGSICAADLNGDGLLDVLVGHPTGPLSVSWYPNLGNAQFGSQ
jgi:hypothetical protein